MTTTERRAQARAEYEYAASALWRAADCTYVLRLAPTEAGETPSYFAGIAATETGKAARFTHDVEEAAWFKNALAERWKRTLLERYGAQVWTVERSRPAAVEPSEFDAREAVEAEGDGDG